MQPEEHLVEVLAPGLYISGPPAAVLISPSKLAMNICVTAIASVPRSVITSPNLHDPRCGTDGKTVALMAFHIRCPVGSEEAKS